MPGSDPSEAKMNPELTEKSPDGAIIIEHYLKTTHDDACGSCGFAARAR
jgi:hypothetical protein